MSIDPAKLLMDRRTALKLLAAGITSTLAACGRPLEEIVPYVDIPDGLTPGIPMRFATALPLAGYGRGVLVRSVEGGPSRSMEIRVIQRASGQRTCSPRRACCRSTIRIARVRCAIGCSRWPGMRSGGCCRDKCNRKNRGMAPACASSPGASPRQPYAASSMICSRRFPRRNGIATSPSTMTQPPPARRWRSAALSRRCRDLAMPRSCSRSMPIPSAPARSRSGWPVHSTMLAARELPTRNFCASMRPNQRGH